MRARASVALRVDDLRGLPQQAHTSAQLFLLMQGAAQVLAGELSLGSLVLQQFALAGAAICMQCFAATLAAPGLSPPELPPARTQERLPAPCWQPRLCAGARGPVLGEACSAFDPASERKLLANQRRPGCGVLLVTQQQEVPPSCDARFVVDEGRLVTRILVAP